MTLASRLSKAESIIRKRELVHNDELRIVPVLYKEQDGTIYDYRIWKKTGSYIPINREDYQAPGVTTIFLLGGGYEPPGMEIE